MARGGFEVDIAWKDGKLTQATVRSKAGLPCKVVYADQTWELKTKAGQSYPIGAANEPSPKEAQQFNTFLQGLQRSNP